MPFVFRSHRRSGLTLIEILIALTMTLIVLGTMITAFKFASERMQDGRALIELATRARIVEDHLRSDLSNLTVETRVYNKTAEPNGYFEYIEGPVRDSTFALSAENFQGDCDDLICFTARSRGGVLFRGRRKVVTGNGNAIDDMTLSQTIPIESSLAEIAWFTTVNDNDSGAILQAQTETVPGASGVSSADFDDSIRIHRRVLLIRPDFNDPATGAITTNLSGAEVNNFIRNNDISVRVVPTVGSTGTFDVIANELDELAVRKHRFAHQQNLTTGNPITDNRFPNTVTFNLLRNRIASDDSENVNYDNTGAGAHSWQPLPPIISDVGAFDFKAYSPTARVKEVNDVIVEPSDPGFAAAAAPLVQRGAYVDLAYNITAPANQLDEWFISDSNRPTTIAAATRTNVWDTWTPFYERDGVDQDQDLGLGVDQGTNGINDIRPGALGDFPVATNAIDDPGERETIPPYFQPIRAMKITLRLVEKGTKQVHQVSVIQSFVPE